MTRPALAVERTMLAWSRTGLSAAVCGLLLLRLGAGSTGRLGVALGAGGTALAVLAWTGRRRAGRLGARTDRSPVDPDARAVGTTAATVTLLGLAAAALVATR